MKPCLVLCCIGLVVLGGGATAAGAAPTEPQAGPGSLSGVWFNARFSTNRADNLPQELPRTRTTVDGQPPPFLPWAKAEVDKRLQSFRDGEPVAKLSANCIPGGTPQMMQPPPQLPIQILETPGQVTMLVEQLTNFRIIYLDAKHETDPDPTFFGDSIARWERGELVVDTIGLTTRTTLDQPGMPHSEALHVVERYRRMDANTLEVKVTIDDPKVFTAPWTAVTHFKLAPPDREIEEYICENNRNLTDGQGIGTQVSTQGR